MTQNGTGTGGSAKLYSAVLARGAPPSSDTREYMSDFHIIDFIDILLWYRLKVDGLNPLTVTK